MSEKLFEALFDDASLWQVFASGQALGALTKIENSEGRAGLRLQYDFRGGGGFVVIRRTLDLTLPTTFELGFQLRGEGPPNHFECKAASPGGANVWRHLRKDYVLPLEWQPLQIHEREMIFAWGPAGGGAPSQIEAIEFVIAAGPGGKGHFDLCAPNLLDQTLQTPAAITASSDTPEHPAAAAFASDDQEWHAAASDPDPWWSIDFGRSQRFGGLIIEWPDDLPARAYEVEISNDGKHWQRIYRAGHANGARSHLSTPAAEARHLRLRFAQAACAALRSIHLQPDAFSQTPNEFIHSVARDYPRGWHPRYWHREQSYWTPVGSPEGKRRALINEEGMVEVDEGGFSLEPFLLTATGLLTWADIEITAALAPHGAPLPIVTWKNSDLALDIEPWVDGEGETLTLRTTYRLRRNSPAQGMRLAIAIRPFQVNPPWQAFRNLGGCSPISRISLSAKSIKIQDRPLFCEPAAAAMGAARFEEGGVLPYLANGKIPPSQQVTDSSERASAVLAWDIPADAETYEVTVSMPYFTTACPITPDGQAQALAHWQRTISAVTWQVPTSAQDAFDCWRTAAGHILINRDGPAIQPGPRRYTRSWVRDCVIMGAALAKVGLPQSLRIFIDWYAAFQREDGFVPCVVDRDGIDWLVEHDSHGQFLWGIREVYRQNSDPTFLQTMLPRAQRAAEYLVEIRRQRMTAQYRSHELGNRYGLLPESASHEGYLAHPVHSYWDDFWGIRGLQACAELCENAQLTAQAARWTQESAAFNEDVMRSIRRVIAEKNLNYIPGSVEWADFDPTATANAIAMLDFADDLPNAPLHGMLDTYLDGFHRKHSGAMPWNNYTAYEIRIIGAFVRLGKRETAQELLAFFLSDRRPCAWNQWPEITWRDPRSPGHLGDVPHTWIAAEYILALTSMIAAEREATHSLVLAAGIPWLWISHEQGFTVRDLPTQYGTLNLHLHAPSDDSIFVEISGTVQLPPGGIILQPPCPARRSINAVESSQGSGSLVGTTPNTMRIEQLPFQARLQLSPSDHLT